jgi:hypothetical protein
MTSRVRIVALIKEDGCGHNIVEPPTGICEHHPTLQVRVRGTKPTLQSKCIGDVAQNRLFHKQVYIKAKQVMIQQQQSDINDKAMCLRIF